MAGGDPSGLPLVFAYHQGLAPMLWAFAALGMMELFVVHLLLALLWSMTAALVASLLTLATLVWLVLFIRSLKRRPVTLDETELVLRTGNLMEIRVARDNVAGLRTSWPDGFLGSRTLLNLSLINQPNLVIDLKRPFLRRRRPITSVAHRLDDPLAFAAALAPAREPGS